MLRDSDRVCERYQLLGFAESGGCAKGENEVFSQHALKWVHIGTDDTLTTYNRFGLF